MIFYGSLFIGDGIINLYDPFEVTPSEAVYTTPGTYSWTAPANVKSVSVVAVGGGGAATVYFGSGGGGGALAFKNNIPVTAGNTYTIVVGAGGAAPSQTSINGGNGLPSYFQVLGANVCFAAGG